METIKLTMVQPNVENVFGDATRIYGIIAIADNKEVIIANEEEVEDYTNFDIPGYYKLIANVEVTCPAIMAGSAEETDTDIIHAIERELLEAGICTENAAGVLFAK